MCEEEVMKMIRNKINEILDALPDEELERVYWVFQIIQKQYLFRKNLVEKGVSILVLFEEAQEIMDTWDQAFAKDISDERKAAIHFDQHKWHIFSYEEKKCLKEEAARVAFDTETKDEL